MKVLEQRQEFVKGMFAGLIAAIVMYVFVELFRWIGLTKFGVSYLAGDTVFTYENNFKMHIIAFFIHCGVGMFWGVNYFFLFPLVFSRDYYLLKVVFGCGLIFFFHLGFLGAPFHYKKEMYKQTFDLLIILFGYLIYGLVIYAFLKKHITLNE